MTGTTIPRNQSPRIVSYRIEIMTTTLYPMAWKNVSTYRFSVIRLAIFVVGFQSLPETKEAGIVGLFRTSLISYPTAQTVLNMEKSRSDRDRIGSITRS